MAKNQIRIFVKKIYKKHTLEVRFCEGALL